MKPSRNWSLACLIFFICIFHIDAELRKTNAENCTNPEECSERQISPISIPSTRQRCKNVTLKDGTYEFTEGDQVFVPRVNLTFAQWNVAGQEVQVCIPFSRDFLTCKRWLLNGDEYRLSEDGLDLEVSIYNRVYGPSDFYIRSKTKDAVICINLAPEQETDDTVDISLALGITWIISAVSLVIAGAICVAFAIPETYRVVLPFYMVNLFVAYVVLIARLFGDAPTTTVCLSFGVVLHFSLLSAFFWLNVVAFHVWRTVAWIRRGDRPTFSGCLLAVYILYGWGSPFLISLITFLVESGQLFSSIAWLQPQFHSNCWFGPRSPMLVFFYAPMAAILTANLVFFVLTIANLQSANKYYSSKPAAANQKMIGTAMHLIVVMGLCWIMEAFSWAIGGDPRYWFFTDLLNGLQGFFVLVVVIADARIYSKLCCCGTSPEIKNQIGSVSSDISGVTVESKAKSFSE